MNAVLLASSGGGEFIFVIFAAVAIVIILVGIFRNSSRADNLKFAADRFGGTVASSFWGNDRLAFDVDGVPAELTYQAGGRNESEFTRVRFRYTTAGILRVVPEGFVARLRKMFGAQDIELGDPSFDRAFLIQGSPVPWVRDILDPEARRRISALASLGASFWQGSHVHLDAGPGGVTIACARNFVDDRGRLLGFLDQAVALFRQIRTPAIEGIKILSAEEHADRGECPVCANRLEGQVHRCTGCGTPHHRDCWDYFRGCAIYACPRRGGNAA